MTDWPIVDPTSNYCTRKFWESVNYMLKAESTATPVGRFNWLSAELSHWLRSSLQAPTWQRARLMRRPPRGCRPSRLRLLLGNLIWWSAAPAPCPPATVTPLVASGAWINYHLLFSSVWIHQLFDLLYRVKIPYSSLPSF